MSVAQERKGDGHPNIPKILRSLTLCWSLRDFLGNGSPVHSGKHKICLEMVLARKDPCLRQRARCLYIIPARYLPPLAWVLGSGVHLLLYKLEATT